MACRVRLFNTRHSVIGTSATSDLSLVQKAPALVAEKGTGAHAGGMAFIASRLHREVSYGTNGKTFWNT
jgi:hypothetical protein